MSDPFGYLAFLKQRLAGLQTIPPLVDNKAYMAGYRAEKEYLRTAVSLAQAECDCISEEHQEDEW